jgi:hypothetical protein
VRSPRLIFLHVANITISGPYLGFGGAAWNLRPTLQVFSSVLSLHFHYSDTEQRKKTARHLGALKRAIRSLREYYELELPAINDPHNISPPQAPFPYVTSFSSIGSSGIQNFIYLSQPMSDKLIFIGKLQTGKHICVKFVKDYSEKAHSSCASMGFAPALIGFDRIPGGWYMVVMDAIDDDYRELHELPNEPSVLDGITEKIISLHQAGFVHGDIRDTNIMVRKDGETGFMLVDFDWAGEIGMVRYPMNVNRGDDLWRPDGAQDGELITANHDMQMLEHMLFTHHLSMPT